MTTTVGAPHDHVDGDLSAPSGALIVVDVVVRVLAMVWSFTLLWLLMWSVAPMVVGWQPLAITSGSMAPALEAGTVVHIDPMEPVDLGIGAIIAFADGSEAGSMTHRIVGIEYAGDDVVGFRTKGDANATVDTDAVATDAVIGAVRLVVPNAAMPAVWQDRGSWGWLALFVGLTIAAGLITADTIVRLATGANRLRWRRTDSAIAVAVAMVAALVSWLPSTSSAFSGETDATSTFSMSGRLYLDAVDADGAVIHWRLDDFGADPVDFADDFETFEGWNQFGSGTFTPNGTIVRTGSGAGSKETSNDPNGAWKSLGGTLGGDFEMEAWVYRPSNYAGGAADRFGVENSAFEGYSINITHSTNRLTIDRRSGGSSVQTLGGATLADVPEDEWMRARLSRSGTMITAELFDDAGTLLGSTTASDTSVAIFDRFAVHGGFQYLLDDVSVSSVGQTTIATDRLGVLDATYGGTPILDEPPLLANDPTDDFAVDLDGVQDAVFIGDSNALNLVQRAERTWEAWISADATGPRSVIYDEGGGTNGMNVYVEAGQLVATAWSRSNGWSKHLVTAHPIVAATTYHVAVVLDAVDARSLTLYVDGVAVDIDVKTDASVWWQHSDNGALGAVSGTTRFPDGGTTFGGFFDGRIDEVAIYNTALPAERIAVHHELGS